MELVAHTSSRSSRSRKPGMSLSSSLVTPCSPPGCAGSLRSGAISSTSSMKTRTRSSSAIRANALRRAAARLPSSASRDGSSSTNGQPSLEAIPRAKVVFPVPGRTEQGDRPRRPDPVPGGALRLRQRQHDTPLDEVLLRFHTGHLGPQVARQEPSAEVLQETGRGPVERLDLLEVGHGRLPRVAGVEQPLAEQVLLGEHIGDTAHPGGDQPPLQLHQQRARQTPAAPGRGDGDPHHPGPLTCDTARAPRRWGRPGARPPRPAAERSAR